MKVAQKVFLGHSVKDSPLLIDPRHTPNAKNVRTDNPIGALNNLIGIQKYTNAGSPEAVVAIHQLGDTLFFGAGSKWWRGLNANFLAFPECGYPPDTGRVQFIDITKDIDGDITAWLWDFGDGDTSTEQHPMHTYTATGTYTVSLKVFVGDLWFQKVEEQYIRFDSSRICCDAFLDIPWTGAHWCYNFDTGEWEYYDGETTVASGEDSYVHASLPDENFGSENELKIIRQSGVELCRIFIKNPQRKDKLYLYCYSVGTEDNANIEAYKVTESWDESTLTWNNQPSLGGRICTTSVPDASGWRSFNIGGVESLCLLFPEQGSGYYTPGSLFFYSINNSSNNPYFTYPANIPQCCIADDIMPDGLKPKEYPSGDAQVESSNPDTNRGSGAELIVYTSRNVAGYTNYRIFIKRDTNHSASFYFYYKIQTLNPPDIQIYAITDSWDEDTLTWNNKPALGSLITTLTPSASAYNNYIWKGIEISTATSFCMKFETEFGAAGSPASYNFVFKAKENIIVANRSYFIRA